jgi:S1-C subfamily serine protease
MELPELMEHTRRSVVLVTVYDAAGHPYGRGSGFFVAADGRFVTNVHVIEHAARATVTTADGTVVAVDGLLAQDAAADVAVLKAAGDGFPTLTLGDTQGLAPGDEIVVVGSPLGLAGTLSTGIVAAIRDAGPLGADDLAREPGFSSWRIQISAPISAGSSGSPVLARDGRVVGVAVGQRSGGQNLNFCVPIEFVRALVDRLGARPTPQPLAQPTTWREVGRNLAISAGVFVLSGLGYAFIRRRSEDKPDRVPAGRDRLGPS